jgi:nitric oxide dioxygenase
VCTSLASMVVAALASSLPNNSRRYSLSDAPSPDHYRISVKRDRGVVATRAAGSGDLTVDPTASAHPGWLSNLLHDTLQEGADIDVAYPFGDFVLEPGTGPVVLLAAGVGATPLLAMLNALLADANSPRQVSWVQVARTPAALPFRVDIANAARAHPDRLRTALFYSHTVDEGESQTCVPGRLDIAKVDTSLLHLEDGAAEYYTCGPATFMCDMTRELAARGVDTGRVHAEVFGSGGLA